MYMCSYTPPRLPCLYSHTSRSILDMFDPLHEDPEESTTSSFFLSLEYGIIPNALRAFVDSEGSDIVRTEIIKAMESVIEETLIDAEFSNTQQVR